MLKYHSLHGHLYYYIGDYRTYLPNSDQLGFIYRGMDRAHDVLLPRLDKNVQDYVHDRTDAKSVGNKAVGVQAPHGHSFANKSKRVMLSFIPNSNELIPIRGGVAVSIKVCVP